MCTLGNKNTSNLSSSEYKTNIEQVLTCLDPSRLVYSFSHAQANVYTKNNNKATTTTKQQQQTHDRSIQSIGRPGQYDVLEMSVQCCTVLLSLVSQARQGLMSLASYCRSLEELQKLSEADGALNSRLVIHIAHVMGTGL